MLAVLGALFANGLIAVLKFIAAVITGSSGMMAEALRQAMLAYLNDASSPRNAHPALWAPFALIGEGAAR